MLELLKHTVNHFIISNEATHVKVDYVYNLITRDQRFTQCKDNIDSMFTKLQEKIDTAEEAHVTLGEMEMDTAYSPITR